MKKSLLFLIIILVYLNASAQQNGFVIGVYRNYAYTVNVWGAIYSGQYKQGTNFYSSLYGVYHDDGFNMIRTYNPGEYWGTKLQYERYISLIDNNNLQLIDDNTYFYKTVPSTQPDGRLTATQKSQCINEYDIANTQQKPFNLIYKYDYLYQNIYSNNAYKDVFLGHVVSGESNSFHWYPHIGVFPNAGHWIDSIPLLKQYYSSVTVPSANVSAAIAHFDSLKQSTGCPNQMIINTQARHGRSYLNQGNMDDESVMNYLTMQNRGDLFVEASYYHYHWKNWVDQVIPQAGNDHDYLGKFINIDVAEQYYSKVLAEVDVTYSDGFYHIKDYIWHTDRTIPNANNTWFKTYNSIIHGAKGIIFYKLGDDYIKKNPIDSTRRMQFADSLNTDNSINNFVISNESYFYEHFLSNLAQELRYLKQRGFLSNTNSSMLFSKTSNADINGVLNSSTTYLPQNVLVTNAQSLYNYTHEDSNGVLTFPLRSEISGSPASFFNYHRSEKYGLRYTVRTNGDEVIMIVTNPNPYAIVSNVPLNFNGLSNPIIAKSTGVNILFENSQVVTSSTYKTDRNWIDRQLFIDKVIDDTANIADVKCSMQRYAIQFPTIYNKSISLNFGPFDVKVIKFGGEIISANTIWNTDTIVENDIVIEPGNTLTIKSVVKFLASTKMVVKPGAKLIIDGGTLSSCNELWKGVLVQGDNNYDQSDESKQGVLEMKNNASIENAEVAVYVGEYFVPNSMSSVASNYGHGIIKISNSNFYNNQRDIVMRPNNVLNIYGGGQAPPYFNCYVVHSVFKNDASMLEDPIMNFGKMGNIYLTDVVQFRIAGNTFKNDNPNLLLTDQGTGVLAINSKVNIIDYPDPQCFNCTPIKNKFINLYEGVRVISGLNNYSVVRINNSEFINTYHSIFISGGNNQEILQNSILVPNQLTAQAGQPTPIRPYGIYINQSKGFKVEENTIYRPSQIGAATYNGARGIIVHKTGAVNNEIYKNTLNNLFLSEQAQCANSGTDLPPWGGSNNPGAETGLKFFCNTSQTSSASYDMWMGGMGYCTPFPSSLIGAHRFGIAKFQKQSLINPSNGLKVESPAGNQFSDSHLSLPTTATVDFDNGQAGWLEYSWADLDGTSGNGSWQPVRKDNVGDTLLPVSIDVCPSKISSGGNGTTISQLYTKLSSAQIALNSSITLLNIWKDGGNANLDDQVETTQPWDVYQQFNSLLAESPYLSDEVLIEVIQNPSFTSLMVKLLMIANPHAVHSDAVMYELENRNPAMPQSYIDEIKSQPETTSQLQVLEGNVAADNHLVSMKSEDIKRIYRADNEHAWAKDSLIAFVSRRPGLYDKYELATIYLSYGLYSDMQNTLNYIDGSFELEEDLQSDYTDFVNLMSVAKNMQENNLYEEGLSETQRTSLQTILNNDRPITSAFALSLLMRDNPNFVFNEAVYDVPQNSARKAQPEISKLSSESAVNDEFKLYPNPARDYTTLQYNCQYENTTYTISSMQGKVLISKLLKTFNRLNTNEVLIDLNGLSPGTYHFVIRTNNLILWNGKLIVIE